LKQLFLIREDSASGVTAARKAGIKSTAFENPSSGNQNLSSADGIVHTVSDIDVPLVDRLPG
jgi:beta-phosphoglucomutase-like phosphatase (HAD superfamily)